jgi:hypothetical protein
MAIFRERANRSIRAGWYTYKTITAADPNVPWVAPMRAINLS